MLRPMLRRLVREIPYLVLCAAVLVTPLTVRTWMVGQSFTDILWR